MSFDNLDLHQEMYESFKRAEELLEEMKEQGIALAKAERDYSIACRKATIYERDRGTAATLVDKLVKGREDIANLRFEVACAEALYKAAYEGSILAKKKADILEKMIEREWANEVRR